MLLYAGGWRVIFFPSTAFGIVAQCLLVILFVNAFNFLDRADGLAAGITAAIALGYAAMPGAGLSAFGYAVAWSLPGACVGFLIFNFPPAKIFMGDSGSRCWDSAWRSWVWISSGREAQAARRTRGYFHFARSAAVAGCVGGGDAAGDER